MHVQGLRVAIQHVMCEQFVDASGRVRFLQKHIQAMTKNRLLKYHSLKRQPSACKLLLHDIMWIRDSSDTAQKSKSSMSMPLGELSPKFDREFPFSCDWRFI